MRRAGVLMPIFSLPSPYGIGTLGAEARSFADFLAMAGQACWQVLPMGPTSYGDSPYQSFSSYAGNHYLIDLDDLFADGLLEAEEYRTLDWGQDPDRVDYQRLYQMRVPVLRLACGRAEKHMAGELSRFCREERAWLDDYALFMALKEENGGAPWIEWPEPIRKRDRTALREKRRELAGEIRFWSCVQFLFFRQWDALRKYLAQYKITVIGDLPIYVPLDSADVWSHPEQFQLDEEGRPTEVAGCPPDAFSDDGQLWGNPLFDWERMKRTRYSRWMNRISFQFRLYDTLRIDHFRGFEAYYAIPAEDKTARNGRWRPGPGVDFFSELRARLGPRDIIAEDLGYLTEGVHRLLDYTGFPGMKVLEFAFGQSSEDSAYLPHNINTKCVAYAGTHDNDTILGWLSTCPAAERSFAKRYMRLDAREGYNWGVLRTLWASASELTIVQMQDLLGLGSEGRINTPSTLGNNWQWRMNPSSYTLKLARQVRKDMEVYQRLHRRRGRES